MKLFRIIGLVLVLLAVVFFIYFKLNHIAPLSMVDKTAYSTRNGVAIKGYDPVSYFVEGAMKGNEAYSTEWKGTTWQFASVDNRDLFLSNPNKYAPQFGGYCAFAVTAGFTATADPDAYLIQDGKLYLFNGEDVRINFMVNTDQSITTAHANWEAE